MSFDALAPYYRSLEFVLAGNVLQRCRTAFLDDVAHARTALLLGEGPGRYLIELLRVNKNVRVLCLDSSARMLAVAKERLQARGLAARDVRFVCTDWADWPGTGGPFDLVATHFFLDCFDADRLARLVSKVASQRSGSAIWVLSDFREPPTGWKRYRAKTILRLAYWFFHWSTAIPATSLTAPDPFLTAAGFTLFQRRVYNRGLLHADLWKTG